MSDRLARDAALCLVIAAVAIAAYAVGMREGETWAEPIGSSTRSVAASDTPRPEPTAGLGMVIVVTMTPLATLTSAPTMTPFATATPYPDCGPKAIPGRVCLAAWPTKPPAVYTPIPLYNPARATAGSKYIYVEPTVNPNT